MTSKMNGNPKLRLVRCPRCRNILPEPPEVQVYKCGGCDAVLQAKKRKNDTVETTSRSLEEDLSGKRKIEQVSDNQEAGSSSNHSTNEPDRKSHHNDLRGSTEGQDAADQEACSSSNQKSQANTIYEPDPNSDHNDPRSSTELSGNEDPESSPEATAHNRIDQEQEQEQEQDEDEAKKQENVAVHATSGGIEHPYGKQKIEQLSDDQEAGSTSNQQLLVNSMDIESSLGAKVHVRTNQDQDQDQEQSMFIVNDVLENCKNGDEYDESSRELTASPEKFSFSELNDVEEPSREASVNMKIIRDSDVGSKSSFRSLIAEKLLDTRQKKVVYRDEDDILSEDGSADLCHHPRFERISSVETSENARFRGTSYYGYGGSVSSFDGDANQLPRNRHRFKRPDECRLQDVRSFYGNASPSRLGPNKFHENPRNPKMERLELLKMVRELQDQLERTNVSNAAQQVPSYYERVLNHPGRYGQRMAFSGEAAAANRRRDDSLCYHPYPQDFQDRHFSAQLPTPRPRVFCSEPHYVPSGCYSSHCSGPSEPEFFASGHSKPEPDDYRPRNDFPKPHRSPKKRYVRPIAGGSPWITCYRCSKVLQLPESFLVCKKRYNSLRCGACLKVLSLTLSNGTHVHRYYPEETIAAPPTSEVEDYAHSTESRAGPVSCSDRSFQKSYSTETDGNGFWGFTEERRKGTMSRDPSASSAPSSSSSKIPRRRNTRSEIEEIEPAYNGSPLHWLMGYASPSKVIRG